MTVLVVTALAGVPCVMCMAQCCAPAFGLPRPAAELLRPRHCRRYTTPATSAVSRCWRATRARSCAQTSAPAATTPWPPSATTARSSCGHLRTRLRLSCSEQQQQQEGQHSGMLCAVRLAPAVLWCPPQVAWPQVVPLLPYLLLRRGCIRHHAIQTSCFISRYLLPASQLASCTPPDQLGHVYAPSCRPWHTHCVHGKV
jgi:hypothetical protein